MRTLAWAIIWITMLTLLALFTQRNEHPEVLFMGALILIATSQAIGAVLRK